MITHIIDIPFEIKIVGKLLLMLDEKGIPILMEDLIIDEVETGLSFCLLGKGIAILQTFLKPSIS